MRERRLRSGVLLLGIALYALLVGAYYILRFAGRWSEGDTATLTAAIAHLLRTGRLIPDVPGPVYLFGPGYPALSTFLAEVSGISAQTLTAHVYPLTVALLAFVSFALYRNFTGSVSAGLLATLFLFLQPDFLWVTFRGSHEKMTWALVLTAFFLLARSFSARSRIGVLAKYVFLFYLVVFALLASNAFFASSFIAALTMGALGGALVFVLGRRYKTMLASSSEVQVRRLLYVFLSCSVLLYLFIFHIYPPLRNAVYILGTLLEQLAALLLGVDLQFDPYAYVSTAWTSLATYVALTLFNYTVLLTSFAVWVRGIPRLLRPGSDSERDLPKVLLWLLYPAFAFQLALAVISDRAGVLGGNFQVRLFTPMMIIAIPLAAMGVQQAWSRVKPGLFRGVTVGLAVILVCWFGAAALMKATNEPALNKQWIFYSGAEQQAGAWIARHVASAQVWAGEERLLSAMELSSYPHQGIDYEGWSVDPATRYYLFSTLERVKYARLGLPMPYFQEENRVYDNGEVQLYHRRPKTPYQR